LVGYDNERGKGDHKHIRGAQAPYTFKDVPTLIRDFLQDVQETES
jgi:arginine utilization protein RocB